MRQYLRELTQRTEPVLDKLQEQVKTLPPKLAERLLGNQPQQELQVRLQLRARWLEETPAWAFPYRSILGLLTLTSNAWDRLVLSMLGSWPSAVVTVWQSFRNMKDWWQSARKWQRRFARTFEAEARAVLLPLLQELRKAVLACRNLPSESIASATSQTDELQIRLVGLEEFQQRCRDQLQESISRHLRPNRAWRWAALATLVFGFFLAGPIVAIYREYLRADVSALTGERLTLHDFPYPSYGQLLACFVLSALPVGLLGIVSLGWTTRRWYVSKIRDDWRLRVQELSRTWQEHRLLRLEYEDPLLGAVEVLSNLTRDT